MPSPAPSPSSSNIESIMAKMQLLLPASPSSWKLLTFQRAANLAIRHLLPTAVGASASTQMQIGLTTKSQKTTTQVISGWTGGRMGVPAPPLVMRGGTHPPRPHATHPIKTGSTFKDFADVPPPRLETVPFADI